MHRLGWREYQIEKKCKENGVHKYQPDDINDDDDDDTNNLEIVSKVSWKYFLRLLLELAMTFYLGAYIMIIIIVICCVPQSIPGVHLKITFSNI